MADATLGEAILRVTLDDAGLQMGLSRAKGSSTAALTDIERRAEQSGNRIGRSLQQGFDVLGNLNLGGLFAAGGAIAGLVRLEREAFLVQTGMRLLERQLERNNISWAEGEEAINSLAEELHVMPESLADNVAQLLRTGLTMEEISAAFRGGAASALAFGKDVGTGIDTISSAIITGRSQLLDSIGISQNLDIAYKEYAETLGTTADKLDTMQRAQAAVHLITQYTKEEVEDLPLMFEGFGGATNDLTREFQELRVEFGEQLMPVMTNAIRALADVLGFIKELPGPVKQFGTGAAVAAVGVRTLAIAVSALKLALGSLAGPAGIILGVAAAVGGLAMVLYKRGSGGDDLATASSMASEALAGGKSTSLTSALGTLAEQIDNSGVKESIDNLSASLTSLGESSLHTAEIVSATLELDYLSRKYRQAAEDVEHFTEASRLAAMTNEQLQAIVDDPTRTGTERLEARLTISMDSADRELMAAEYERAMAERDAALVEIQAQQGTIDRLSSMVEEEIRNKPPPGSAGGGGADGDADAEEVKRKWQDVFTDLAEDGYRAQQLAAEMDDELGGLEATAGLVSRAMTELMDDFDFEPTSAEVRYLIGRLAELNAEIEALGGAPVGSVEALRAQIAALREDADRAPTEAIQVAIETEIFELEQELERRIQAATPRDITIEPEVKVRPYMTEQEIRAYRRSLGQLMGSLEGPTPDAQLSQGEISSYLQDARDRQAEEAERLAEIEERRRIRAQQSRGGERDRESVSAVISYEEVQKAVQAIRELREEEAQLAWERETRRSRIDRVWEQGQLGDDTIPSSPISREDTLAGLRAVQEREAAERAEALERLRVQRESLAGDEVVGDTSAWEDVRKVTKGVREELERLDVRASIFGETQDLAADKASVLERAIVRLVDMGLHPQGSIISGLVEDYRLYSDAADISADTILAQANAAEEAAQAQNDLATAVERANGFLGNAPTALEAMITGLEEMRDSGKYVGEDLEKINALLDQLGQVRATQELSDQFNELANTVGIVGSALTTLFEADWSNGNEAIEAVSGAAADLVSLIPGIGPALGEMINTVGSVLSTVLGDLRNGLREVKAETEEIQDRFEIIDIASLVKTEQVSRGGLLGLLGFTYTQVNQEASELGLSIAESIEGGVLSGLRNGLDRFIETGNIDDLEFAIQSGIYQGVTDALMVAIVEEGVIQSILGPSLLRLTEAIASGYETGSYSNALGILADIQALVPKLASYLTPIFDSIRGLQPEDPNAPEEDERTARPGGRQISEFTGPSRDLLTDLLTPLAHLSSVPGLMQAQLGVQERIFNQLVSITGNSGAPGSLGRPWNPIGSAALVGTGAGGEVITIENLNMTTDARSARELYRDISAQHSIVARGRRR